MKKFHVTKAQPALHRQTIPRQPSPIVQIKPSNYLLALTPQELVAFQKVGAHRNKMVHFFHKALKPKAAKKFKSEIAIEQLDAWYLLHKALTNRWKNVFEKWSPQINKVDSALRQRQIFLKVIFTKQKIDIDRARANGIKIRKCPSCGFESQEWQDTKDRIFPTHCHVCELRQSYLVTKCPECPKNVTFVGEGFATCFCGKEFEPDDVAALITADEDTHARIKDGDDRWELGNCSICDSYHQVVRVDDTHYCTCCFSQFASLENCGWCGEPNTGDMEFSYSSGCNFCDGKYGHDD